MTQVLTAAAAKHDIVPGVTIGESYNYIKLEQHHIIQSQPEIQTLGL